MRPDVFQAHELFRVDSPTLGAYGRRFLAEGDSSFTIGSMNLARTSNILLNRDFSTWTAVASCAYPGHTFQHMVDSQHDSYFDRLLWQRNFASDREALLILRGVNDLIDAAPVPQKIPTASQFLWIVGCCLPLRELQRILGCRAMSGTSLNRI